MIHILYHSYLTNIVRKCISYKHIKHFQNRYSYVCSQRVKVSMHMHMCVSACLFFFTRDRAVWKYCSLTSRQWHFISYMLLHTNYTKQRLTTTEGCLSNSLGLPGLSHCTVFSPRIRQSLSCALRDGTVGLLFQVVLDPQKRASLPQIMTVAIQQGKLQWTHT